MTTERSTSDILLVAATERELCGHEGLVCGVGPVEAAATTALALADGAVGAVLHVGVAGARRKAGLVPPALAIGSVAIFEDLRQSGLSPTEARPDETLFREARRVLPGAAVLPIGTTGRVGGTSVCAVEAMEGFAVLRAAELAGVAAIEVRAISNLVEDARADWRLDDALAALAAAIPRLLDALSR